MYCMCTKAASVPWTPRHHLRGERGAKRVGSLVVPTILLCDFPYRHRWKNGVDQKIRSHGLLFWLDLVPFLWFFKRFFDAITPLVGEFYNDFNFCEHLEAREVEHRIRTKSSEDWSFGKLGLNVKPWPTCWGQWAIHFDPTVLYTCRIPIVYNLI